MTAMVQSRRLVLRPTPIWGNSPTTVLKTRTRRPGRLTATKIIRN